MLQHNGLAGAGESDRELGDMLQLLIIPRPRMGHERPHRLIGEAGDPSVALRRKDLDEISSEALDVLTATFTQRRDLHGGGAQAKEEVAAKERLSAHPGKVLIGGRHDPYVSWMVRDRSSFLVPASPRSKTVVEVAAT
jgi:hypothetical protein